MIASKNVPKFNSEADFSLIFKICVANAAINSGFTHPGNVELIIAPYLSIIALP